MHFTLEIPKAVRLEDYLPETFEHNVLHYDGTRRYLATWWSEDYQCVVWADGETWRGDEVDDDEWIWWTYKLALSNGFETICLGLDLNLPLCVLMLDLQEREVWHIPIDATFDFLHNQIQQKEHQQTLER